MLFRSTILAAATSFVAVASAQKIYEIDPETVPESLRENWCLNSERSCPLICSQYDNPETLVNTCDHESLTYGCLCGDNIKPNMSEYSLTIPYFTCMEWGNQCVTGCDGNTACATSCREDNPCGAQNPERINATETTSTANPSSSSTGSPTDEDDGTTIFTDTPGSDDDDSSSSNSSSDDEGGAATLLAFGNRFGLSVVLGSMFIGFAMF